MRPKFLTVEIAGRYFTLGATFKFEGNTAALVYEVTGDNYFILVDLQKEQAQDTLITERTLCRALDAVFALGTKSWTLGSALLVAFRK